MTELFEGLSFLRCFYPCSLFWQDGHALGTPASGARRCAFSPLAPALWNTLPPEIRMAMALLALHKALRPGNMAGSEPQVFERSCLLVVLTSMNCNIFLS